MCLLWERKKSEKEIKEEKEKEGKVLDPYNRYCQAVIGTSPWKPDMNTYQKFCEKDIESKDDKEEYFKKCPRLEKYLEYENGIRTLKIKAV